MSKQVKKDSENIMWSDETTLVGIPTLALLPPKNFYFKVLKDKHKITIPKSGTYHDLDKDFFSKEDGEFCIIDDDGTMLNVSAITKVLFGTNKYPKLQYNQLFCPISVVVNKDTVDIFGQVIDMMEPPTGMTVDNE